MRVLTLSGMSLAPVSPDPAGPPVRGAFPTADRPGDPLPERAHSHPEDASATDSTADNSRTCHASEHIPDLPSASDARKHGRGESFEAIKSRIIGPRLLVLDRRLRVAAF